MKLLKVGDHYINLDLVLGFDADPNSEKVSVYFVAGAAHTGAIAGMATYDGAEATALKKWLQLHAEDVMKRAFSARMVSPTSEHDV